MNTALNSSVANCDKDVGDGSAYAQVFHSINRRCVPIKQIKWEAKSEYDYTINFNLVQKALKILKVDKAIPAEALMKGKPLDNIEFCQWLKHYHSHVATVEDYDGFAERENVAPGVSRKVKVSSSPCATTFVPLHTRISRLFDTFACSCPEIRSWRRVRPCQGSYEEGCRHVQANRNQAHGR